MLALLAQKWAIAQQSPKALWLAVGSLLGGVGYAWYLAAHGADLVKVLLVIVVANSAAQACIDFFPANIKPTFSAMARVLPMLVAIGAYLSR